MLARDALPNARKPALQLGGPRICLRRPAAFLSLLLITTFLPMPSHHLTALKFKCLAPATGFQFGLVDEALDPIRHVVCNIGLRLLNRRQVIRIAQARRNFFRAHPCEPRHGINLAAIINGNETATITPRQRETTLLQRPSKCRARIRLVPAFLEQRLELFRVKIRALRLLPFFTRKVERIAIPPVLQSFRHVPAMRAEQVPRHLAQTHLVVG